ncbi:MAG: cytochrome b/b6 domain-containing protein [Gammaproteobacteria bacterium]|nr:cytochrome b/b6 domain-containing protein [Gammaproteobacteria bacterium]
MTESSQIRVWDPLVRFFHWSLVSAFFIAYFTEDDLLTVHSWAGYLILSLLIVRLVWGFIGTRYARFSDFVYSPKNIIQFLKDTLRLRAKRYLGHNPAGGAMVLLLMFSLFMTSASGVLLLGAEEQAGPVAYWFTQSGGLWSDVLEEVHEFFANFTLLLVFVHVIGVLVESLIHKENLVSAMLTGFKAEKRNQTEDML